MKHYIDKDALVAMIKSRMATNKHENPLTAAAYVEDEDILEAINTLEVREIQEEPVSIWHDGCEIPKSETNILMIRKEEKDSNYPPIAGCFHGLNSRIDGRNWGYYDGFCYNEIKPPVKWAYINDILSLSNIKRTVKDCKEPVSEDLEKAANDWDEKASFNPFYMVMNGDKPIGVKQDITTHADSFKAGAKWQKKQMLGI